MLISYAMVAFVNGARPPDQASARSQIATARAWIHVIRHARS